MHSRWDWLHDVLFPRDCACLVCLNEDIIGEDGLCDACRTRIRRAVAPANRLPLSGVSAGLVFTDDIRACVYRLKKGKQAEYAPFFANYMQIPPEWNVDVIVPVPMHAWDEFWRGMHHASLLARELASRTDLPVSDSLLIKTRRTRPQKNMSAKERARNVRNAFSVTERVDGKVIALIDDVYTTGSTMTECARILKQNGAARVYAVCACTVM